MWSTQRIIENKTTNSSEGFYQKDGGEGVYSVAYLERFWVWNCTLSRTR